MTRYRWPEDRAAHDAAEREDARRTQRYLNPYTGEEMSVTEVLRWNGPTMMDRLKQAWNAVRARYFS
jgi:hypothetical protein